MFVTNQPTGGTRGIPMIANGGIQAVVRRRLAENHMLRVLASAVKATEVEGRLVLTGVVPSFYLKQVLQTALRGIEGVREIDNQVDVHWPDK